MKEKIYKILREKGRLSFYEFMNIALYHPEAGYYSTARTIGKKGDFFTSSSVNLFPRTVANHFLNVRKRVDDFFVEIGAGDGAFASEFMKYCIEKGERDVKYAIVEKTGSPFLKKICASYNIRLFSSVNELEEFTGYVFSNELFDSFPARRFKRYGDKWLECYIEIRNDRPVEVFDEPEDPEDVKIATKYFGDAPEGQIVEVQPDMEDLVKLISGVHVSGLFVTLDYFDTPQYLLQRPYGSLRGFSKHRLLSEKEVILKAGEVDITVTVNAMHLIDLLKRYGYKNIEMIRQWQFLQKAGIEEVFLFYINKADTLTREKLKGTFNTIMSPVHMGELFSAIVAEKD